MEHSKSVRTILKHSLNVISNAILLTGIVMMVGAVGSMDIAVETGASGAIDLKTMLIGLALTLIGFTWVHRRQNRDERETFREQDQEIHREFRRMAG